MTGILFVCHGNICRSPMAEYIMKDLVKRAGREADFIIASAAVSREEEGNPMYPPAKRKLEEHHIPAGGHRAHRITQDEYDANDYIIVMDRSNVDGLTGLIRDSSGYEKVHRLLEYTGKPRDIADPWYTGDFETAYRDILAGCKGLCRHLMAFMSP